MYAIRPVRLEDEEKLAELIAKSGLGITSLPRNPERLKKKIEDSLKAFKAENISEGNRKYFFVLENLETHAIGGCCGIYSRTGVNEHNDFYEIQFEQYENALPHQPRELKLLKHVDKQNGPSMLCSLFLSPEFRKENLGRLLSLSRVMFMVQFPQFFTNSVVASIRGYTDDNKHSPFWEGVGRHFFDVDYDVMLKMQINDKDKLTDIIPNSPIYVTLISKEAQDSIGKPHTNSIPAVRMLEGEGFKYTNDIDPFDAGPLLSVELLSTRTAKLRETSFVGEISDSNHNHIHNGNGNQVKNNSKEFILSNNSIDFRACYGNVVPLESNKVSIDGAVAQALNVKVGDTIHYVMRL